MKGGGGGGGGVRTMISDPSQSLKVESQVWDDVWQLKAL